MGFRFFARRPIQPRLRDDGDSAIGVRGPGMAPARASQVNGTDSSGNRRRAARTRRLTIAIALAGLLGAAVQPGIALRADFRREAAARCPTGMAWRFDLTLPSSIIADGLAGAELYVGVGACAP